MQTLELPDAVWLAAARRKNQAVLTEFLAADLDIVATLLDIAAAEADAAHLHRLLTTARRALTLISNFLNRVEDPASAAGFRTRAAQLRALLRQRELQTA
jgi:hypothetical protein